MSVVDVVSDGFLTEYLDVDAFSVVVKGICSDESFAEDVGSALDRPSVFATCKVLSSDIETAWLLERYGFRLVDTNLQFRKSLCATPSPRSGIVLREAEAGDESQVRAIARNELTKSRFHLDPAIPNASAKAIKGDWAGNFFRGRRGDSMVVAEIQGRVVGFLQLLSREQLIVDLIAVHGDFRRHGVAKAMMGFAESLFPQSGEVVVGTQAANMVSVSFYESLGFRLAESSYIFHYHGKQV